jgi:hypothetical protein
MKKNFFKKLSFVMALAMVLSTLAPAASAFAATSPSLNVTGTKYLYLNEEGKVSEYDFNIKNKVAGSTYAWSSDNEAVATVDEATGLTVAKAVGTAHITVAITKSGKTKELTATVKVRDNIETIDVSNAPAGSVAIGETVDLNRSFVTFNGSKTKTSGISRWSVSGTGATIEATTGKFVATAAGTYDVTVSAFQSAALYAAGTYTATKTIKVTVANTMTAAQTDLNTLKVSFGSEVTDTSKLSVYYLVSGTEVVVPTKAITLSTDKKSAVVDLYSNFIEEYTYGVKYTDIKDATFVAATTKLADVKSIAVTTTTAAIGSAKRVQVSLYNANGVDILNGAANMNSATANDDSELNARIELSATSTVAYLNTSTRDLYMNTVGDTITVKATFHTYTYDTTGTETGALSASGVITAVAAEASLAKGIDAWTLTDATFSGDFTTVNHTLAVGDAYYAYVKNTVDVANQSWDSTDYNTTINHSTGTLGTYSFSSSNNSVLMVATNGQLTPVAAGAASIIVSYTVTATNTTSVIGTLPVTVGAERKVAAVTLDGNVYTLSNSFADSQDVTVTVKDQYAATLTSGEYTLSAPQMTSQPEHTTVINGVNYFGTVNPSVSTAPAGTTTSGVVTFVTDVHATPGSYTFKVPVLDLDTNTYTYSYVTVTVSTPSATSTYYKVTTDKASYDEYIKSWDPTENVTINVYQYGSNGVKLAPVTLTPGAVVVTAPDGTTTVPTSVITGGALRFSLVADTNSDTFYEKLDKGTYTVRYTLGGVVYYAYFTVVDTTPAMTFTQNASYYTGSAATFATTATPNSYINSIFAFSYNGYDQEATAILATASGNYVYVNKAYYDETINGVKVRHEVVINKSIECSAQ